MASNDEKLSKFSTAINHYAQEQREKIEQEIAEYKQAQLEEAERQVLHEAYQLIQGEMNARKQLLEKRRQIEEEVFDKAKNRLIDYTKSAQYPSLLQKYTRGLSELFPESGTVLCVKKDDLQYEDLLRQAFAKDCTVQADQDILIGGVRAFHAEKGIMADETLDTMLESQQEWFEETSGMSVV